MHRNLWPSPRLVAPSPEVLKSLQSEIKSKKLNPRDRRMRSVAISLAAEPVGVKGLNQGVFYAEEALPPGIALAAPSRAVRKRVTTGSLKCLVLLVDFPDNPGQRPAQEFKDMLFSLGSYPTGSLRDFYKENSYNQLDVNGDVVGWLRLPQPYSFYTNGQSGTGDYPNNAQKMVEDALALASQQIDFSQFDSDGDQYVDGLFVVHAGGGAEADPNKVARAQKIWSHQWTMPKPVAYNGVTAYSYCTEPEDGLAGVFCHEFGHMLGLPDLYDTTYQSEGVGVWCVMGAGSWNNGGRTPGHFCAWSKTQLGWIKPQVVKKAGALKLSAIEQDKTAAYQVWKKGKVGPEYFLLENRQLTGFDEKLPQSGLVVWHVDDTQHNNDHPGSYWVAVDQADGNLDLETGKNRGDKGDPFPGSSKNTTFDATSSPNTNDKFGNPTGVSITKIALQGGVVTCSVKV